MENLAGIYLIFNIGKEYYGIPVQKVKDIIGMIKITEIPRTPDSIKGVINLRGKIIPIMDLRIKFELEELPYTERTVIIVLEVQLSEEKKFMATIVDSVSEVINISQNNIELPPQYEKNSEDNFIMGMAKVKEKVVMLLNIEKVLSIDELSISTNIREE